MAPMQQHLMQQMVNVLCLVLFRTHLFQSLKSCNYSSGHLEPLVHSRVHLTSEFNLFTSKFSLTPRNSTRVWSVRFWIYIIWTSLQGGIYCCCSSPLWLKDRTITKNLTPVNYLNCVCCHSHCLLWSGVCKRAVCRTRSPRFQLSPASHAWRSSPAKQAVVYSQ